MIFNGTPLTGLTLPHFFSSPKPGSEFPRPYAMFFFSSLNGLRSEVIVRFVDIGGIVDHHCLNVLFITCLYQSNVNMLYKIYQTRQKIHMLLTLRILYLSIKIFHEIKLILFITDLTRNCEKKNLIKGFFLTSLSNNQYSSNFVLTEVKLSHYRLQKYWYRNQG